MALAHELRRHRTTPLRRALRLRRYLQTAEYLFDKVLAANDAGDYFPLHGTCMGFQSISIIAARNESVLETYAYDSEGISWPLTFTADAPSTRLWGEAPASAMQTFSTVDSTVNLHHDGVPPSAYEENPRLAELLIMTSTNVDRVGKPFVSSWVGRNYPITAVQFHPEKVRDIGDLWASLVDFARIHNRHERRRYLPASTECVIRRTLSMVSRMRSASRPVCPTGR